MAFMKNLFTLTDDPELLVCLLADVAAVLREARAAGYPPPSWCAYGCSAGNWASFGPNRFCCRCHSRVLVADQWHRLLTLTLRSCVTQTPWTERQAA